MAAVSVEGKKYPMNFFEDGMNACWKEDPSLAMNISALMLFRKPPGADALKQSLMKVLLPVLVLSHDRHVGPPESCALQPCYTTFL